MTPVVAELWTKRRPRWGCQNLRRVVSTSVAESVPSLPPTTALVPIGNLIIFIPYDPRPSWRSYHTIFIDIYFGIIINRGGGRVDGREGSSGRTPPLSYDGNGGGSILRDRHGNGNFHPSTSLIKKRRRRRNGSNQVGSGLRGP